MTRLKKWFIGDYLDKTDDVFEKARIELTYDYTLFFWILGLGFLGNLIANGLWYHLCLITFACLALPTILLVLKYKQSLNMAGNWYVIQQTVVSCLSVCIEEAKPEMSGPLWTMSFIMFVIFIFGIKRGLLRLIPFISIFIFILVLQTQEKRLDFGIPDSQQLPNQPFVALVPFALCLYLLIVFTRTNNHAAKQINEQKKLVEEKNKEVTIQKEKAERANENLHILSAISHEINSTLDLQKVMVLTYENIRKLMDIDFFIISSYNDKEENVSVKFCVKKGKVVTENFTTSIGNSTSFTALTIKTKKEIIIGDLNAEYKKHLSGEPRLHGPEDLRCESLIFIPLIVKDQVIGLFSVQSEKVNAYSSENIDMLRSMADVIAVALNNSDSFNQINQAHDEILIQKQLVETKNKEITDSIHYAKRIQDALMPNDSYIERNIKKLNN